MLLGHQFKFSLSSLTEKKQPFSPTHTLSLPQNYPPFFLNIFPSPEKTPFSGDPKTNPIVKNIFANPNYFYSALPSSYSTIWVFSVFEFLSWASLMFISMYTNITFQYMLYLSRYRL